MNTDITIPYDRQAPKPTLKKIDGHYFRRLPEGTIRQEGDVYASGLRVECFIGRPVREGATFNGVWRPVEVPAGYRIRDLDEKIAVGDLGATVRNGVISTLPGVEAHHTNLVGQSVRSIVVKITKQPDTGGAQDFVILAPVNVEQPKPERRLPNVPDGYRLLQDDEPVYPFLDKGAKWGGFFTRDGAQKAWFGPFAGCYGGDTMAKFRKDVLHAQGGLSDVFVIVPIANPAPDPKDVKIETLEKDNANLRQRIGDLEASLQQARSNVGRFVVTEADGFKVGDRVIVTFNGVSIPGTIRDFVMPPWKALNAVIEPDSPVSSPFNTDDCVLFNVHIVHLRKAS